jgi:hypothetical protein
MILARLVRDKMEKVVYKLNDRDQFDDVSYDGGGGGDFIEVINITISKVSNGWVITTYFEDDTEIVEVYDIDGKDDGNKQSIKCIIKSMGLENEVKIM